MNRRSLADTVRLLAAAAIVLGFFLPWIDVELWGLLRINTSRGYELPGLIADLFEGEYPGGLRRSIYGLPIAAGLVLVAVGGRLSGLAMAGSVVAITLTILWVGLIWRLTGQVEDRLPVRIDLLKVLRPGFYLTVAGALALAWTLRR